MTSENADHFSEVSYKDEISHGAVCSIQVIHSYIEQVSRLTQREDPTHLLFKWNKNGFCNIVNNSVLN